MTRETLLSLGESAGAGALCAEGVAGIAQGANVEGETAAADAAGEVVAQLDEHLDPQFEVVVPATGQGLPVLPGRGSLLGQGVEGLPDRGERDADPLGGPHEGDPAQHLPGVAALVAGGAPAPDQPFALVEAKSR